MTKPTPADRCTPGDAPLMHLIDAKHDAKDATRFKIVNDDGSVGDVVDFDDLSRLKQWMRHTPPAAQQPVTSLN